MTIVTGGMAIGVIEPILAPHLKDQVGSNAWAELYH